MKILTAWPQPSYHWVGITLTVFPPSSLGVDSGRNQHISPWEYDCERGATVLVLMVPAEMSSLPTAPSPMDSCLLSLRIELDKTAVSGLAATLSTLKALSPLKRFLPNQIYFQLGTQALTYRVTAREMMLTMFQGREGFWLLLIGKWKLQLCLE